MGALFIAIAFVVVCGCAKFQYLDLRYPVYIVVDKSFWSGCEDEPDGAEACRVQRIKRFSDGVNKWFEPFDKANRPKAVILFSSKKLPSNRVNGVIYLKIDSNFCGEDAVACYQRMSILFSGARIVFDNADDITLRVSEHEFGHALGRNDDDAPEGVKSVMSYDNPSDILPLDIKMMCKLHHECRMVKRKQIVRRKR